MLTRIVTYGLMCDVGILVTSLRIPPAPVIGGISRGDARPPYYNYPSTTETPWAAWLLQSTPISQERGATKRTFKRK